MANIFGPRKFNIYKEFKTSYVNIQNNYGCHGGYNRGFNPYFDTCGLHFGNRYGYNSYGYGGGLGYGYGWYLSPKDQATLYTIDAGLNLAMSSVQFGLDIRDSRRAAKAEAAAEQAATEKQNSAMHLGLGKGVTVDMGGNSMVCYKGSDGHFYYYNETSHTYEEVVNQQLKHMTGVDSNGNPTFE